METMPRTLLPSIVLAALTALTLGCGSDGGAKAAAVPAGVWTWMDEPVSISVLESADAYAGTGGTSR